MYIIYSACLGFHPKHRKREGEWGTNMKIIWQQEKTLRHHANYGRLQQQPAVCEYIYEQHACSCTESMGYNTTVAIPATVKLDSRSRGKKTRTEETSGGEGNKNSREVL